MFMTVRMRLTFFYTAILTGFFICFGIFSYFIARETLLITVDNALTETSAEIVDALELLSDGEKTLITIPPNSRFFNLPDDIYVVAIDAREEILAGSQNFEELDVEEPLAMIPPQLYEPQVSAEQVRGQNMRVYTYPLIAAQEGSRELIGYLQVAQSLDEFYQALTRLVGTLVVIGGLVFVFFMILGGFTTHNLLRPLARITAVATQINKGSDLSLRLPYYGRNDEIGRLTKVLNRTLERFEMLYRTQQRLLADVSHELRTPLTTVRGNIDLMHRFGELDPESIAIIQDELERMTRLVGDLLLLARADGGSLPIERRPVDLDTILLEVFRQVVPLSEAKNIEMVLENIVPIRVFGDADRIKQLVLILVDNAIKYTPDNQQVILSLSRRNDNAFISITDTGPGIPAEHLPHIFERFYRVDKARSRSQGGSGLGLSIAKWIAEAHAGNINVQSAPGKGTTFTIRLPALPGENNLSQSDQSMPTSLRNRVTRLRSSAAD